MKRVYNSLFVLTIIAFILYGCHSEHNECVESHEVEPFCYPDPMTAEEQEMWEDSVKKGLITKEMWIRDKRYIDWQIWQINNHGRTTFMYSNKE